MDKHYNGYSLTPDFYHKWEMGIHLELGKDIYQFDENGRLNKDMFNTVYGQVAEIFLHLFKPADDVFVVVNSYPIESKNVAYPNVFKRYLKNRKLKYSISQHDYSWQFDDDDLYVQQMTLLCKVSDINLEPIFKAITHKDFYPLQPRLRKKNSLYAPDVFLVNVKTKCIFHLYDDRGCEIVNTNSGLHEKLLDVFSGWEKHAKPLA